MNVPAIRCAVNQPLPLPSAAPPDETDLGLAQRAAAGEAGAFERIMRKNNRMLFRAARAILHDDTEAEDCVQQAYLLAYRAMGKFSGQSRLSTWLARIVIDEAIARSECARHPRGHRPKPLFRRARAVARVARARGRPLGE